MSEMKQEVILWHGGRDLEHNYRDTQVSSKGRWEHGPGLYLTTHYETARKYAKGGGKTYQVTVELGTHIKDVELPIEKVLDFISQNVVKSKRNDLTDDIHQNMKRMNSTTHVAAETLMNLCINYEALKGEKTVSLNKLLVEHGVDYGTAERFSGRDETVCIVFNLDKIKKVKAVLAKDVSLNDFELIFPKQNNNKLKI